MNRAIQLGTNALGTSAPNPMVGAVVVYNDQIIGEGYTSPYGGPHAEVNAIQSVADKSLLSGASLYVSLEPCDHFGKTPPCTDLILKYGIPEVFIGCKDPHHKVGGRGILKLQQAGCAVQPGILEKECREHHRRFLCVHEKKRPYIILKWAQSPDGFLAPEKLKRPGVAKPFWISNKRSRQMVHMWRSQEDAVLVGSTTVLLDNPELTTRYWKGSSPMRILLDKDLNIKGDFHVLDNSVKTLIITGIRDQSKYREGLVYEFVDFDKPVAVQLCKLLMDYEVTSLIVEGGAQTLQTFLDEGLWDEARIFSGAQSLGKGLKAPQIKGRQLHFGHIGDNSLTILRNG